MRLYDLYDAPAIKMSGVIGMKVTNRQTGRVMHMLGLESYNNKYVTPLGRACPPSLFMSLQMRSYTNKSSLRDYSRIHMTLDKLSEIYYDFM